MFILSISNRSDDLMVSPLCKQGGRWRTLDDQTLCNDKDYKENQNQLHHQQEETEQKMSADHISDLNTQTEICKKLRHCRCFPTVWKSTKRFYWEPFSQMNVWDVLSV